MKLTIVYSLLLMLLSLLGAFSSAEAKCLVLLEGLQFLYSISRDTIFVMFCQLFHYVFIRVTYFNF